ncbi:NAD(P)-binding domain-containing protein [Salinimicrobium sp. GXAS 041]|uniref:NAD(P)-binding domain-containing protein n=1 Tax=Salinimicrobium sp. GXAS 041 TaxID=3400806 RepID=UPI003C792D72
MKISILGCGWLGLPLAKELLQKGHFVKGSTTSPEKLTVLASEGINPYLITVSSEKISGDIQNFLAKTDVLIVDIPPGLRKDPEVDFEGKMERLVKEVEVSEVKKLLFISSTSDYEDTSDIPVYTEEDVPNGTSAASKQLIAVEKMLMQNSLFDTSVIRFGGLIGADRHPVKYLAGRKNIRNPQAPVNLIHQQDCIGIISAVIEKALFGEVYNAVYPQHPSKKEYYSRISEERNLAALHFDENSTSKGKLVESVKVEKGLDYKFQKSI